MFYLRFLLAFAPIFHFKLCNFCWWERKNLFCPRAQGTLATPLTSFKDLSALDIQISLLQYLHNITEAAPQSKKIIFVGLSPDLQGMDQIRKIIRPTDVPDTGMRC